MEFCLIQTSLSFGSAWAKKFEKFMEKVMSKLKGSVYESPTP